MFIFAAEQVQTGHWMTWAAILGTIALFLIVCIMILLLCLSNQQKLTAGPFYLRRAPDILKWIAFVAPILMLIGCAVHIYDRLVQIGISGEYTIDYWTGPIAEFIISTIISFGVSLLCLIGIAIHFFRTASDQ